jgi:hypothetical protein
VNGVPDELFYRGLGYGLVASSVLWAALVSAVYYLI